MKLRYTINDIFDDYFFKDGNGYLISQKYCIKLRDNNIKELFWILDGLNPTKIGVEYYNKL